MFYSWFAGTWRMAERSLDENEVVVGHKIVSYRPFNLKDKFTHIEGTSLHTSPIPEYDSQR